MTTTRPRILALLRTLLAGLRRGYDGLVARLRGRPRGALAAAADRPEPPALEPARRAAAAVGESDEEEVVIAFDAAPDAAPTAIATQRGVEPDAPREPRRLRLVSSASSPKARAIDALTPLEPALAATPARRFFARLVARQAPPLSATSWPTLAAERYFHALMSPRPVLLRRGPALAETRTAADAFDDFIWE
ncbi:MAG: hypothetical protein H6711_17785 [Myxococcales bacterium]|nr:hypothetical protein [Myxococcales bacterium]